MKLRKLLALIFVVATLFVCSITASAAVSGGNWDYDDDGNQVYYVDGEIVKNDWIEEGQCTYYVGADGVKYEDGVYKIDSDYYYFLENGVMLCDDTHYMNHRDEETGKWVADGTYRAHSDGTLYRNEWYQDEYGTWYYYGENFKSPIGSYKIGSDYYYFYDNGRMLSNNIAQDQRWVEEIREWVITGLYRAYSDGKLYVNEWYNDNGYWIYYGEDGRSAIGKTIINGTTYVFNKWGHLVENDTACVWIDDSWENYLVQNGKVYDLKNNVWTKVGEDWYYVQNDKLCSEDAYTINGNKYAFDADGKLIEDTIYYDYLTGKYYFATPIEEGGHISTEKNVWEKTNGEYIYLSADSSVHIGWLDDIYYMTPYMIYGSYFTDTNTRQVYIANESGASKKVSKTGFLNYLGDTVYLENGKIAGTKWVKQNGTWYYSLEGTICKDGVYEIDGKYYYFDKDGKMLSDGWITPDNGSTWYKAGSSGALATGISDGYLFDAYGRLTSNEVVEVNGSCYFSDKNGKVLNIRAVSGWKKVGNDWYYLYTMVSPGYKISQRFLADTERVIDGSLYAFDSQGKLITGQYYYSDSRNKQYYLGDSGAAVKGWYYIDGKWIYGNPDQDGALVYLGVHEISGQRYYFNGYRLETNKTFYSITDGKVYTVNSSGVITSEKDPSGWHYAEGEWDNGEAFYYMNGSLYTGWVGNYYFKDGSLVINDIVYDEEDGKYYFVGKNGAWVSQRGFYKTNYYDLKIYVYIKPDGTIARNEWICSGGKWYYFMEGIMLESGVYAINDENHVFDESGAWLGEITPSDMKNGWHKKDGKWYYSVAGQFVYGQHLVIGGKTYCFDYDGTMLSNCFSWISSNGTIVYYTSSGAMAEYTGWQKIDGKWVYFNSDHTVSVGWIKSGGKFYYQDFLTKDGKDYSEGDDFTIEMVIGYNVVDGELCYFNNSGAFVKKITTGGWQKIDGDWYYIGADGRVVSDKEKYKIGNAYYAFDSDGKMVKNDIANGDFGFRCYNESGALITKAGWYYAGSKWVYVKADGYVAYDGVYNIGGTRYFFSDGYWVK